jgi:hypothetical protein
MNIGSIAWPSDPKKACNLFLEYAVETVIGGSGIEFPYECPDPVSTARGYIAGTISDEEYAAAAVSWWNYVDVVGGFRDLHSREALTARLALCLLCARSEEAPRMGEHLSWFLEVLSFLRLDTGAALRRMEAHFPRVKSQSLCECLKGERRGRVVASRGRDVEVLAGVSSRAMRSSHEADASRCGPRWVKNSGHHAASAA